MDIERLKESYADGFVKGDHIIIQEINDFGKAANSIAMGIARKIMEGKT